MSYDATKPHSQIARAQLQKARQDKRPPKPNLVLGLTPGGHWNPMLGYARNGFCPCGTGLKFKKCCLHKIPLAVDTEHRDKYQAIVNAQKQDPNWKWEPNDQLDTATEKE